MKIVIFCGGYGTRMWPASRKSFPKQFYPLIKGKSFFQTTLNRFKKAFKVNDIFVSTEQRYLDIIKDQAPEIPRENLILEPERKDSLGAIGLATAVINKRFPGEVMFFSWSDHLVGKEGEFLRAVLTAGIYTKKTGFPVSINEVPTFPNIYDGWLKMGKAIDEFRGYQIVEIDRFIEKPELSQAKLMFRSGGYLIHTGNGAWRSDVLINFFKDYAPETFRGLVKIAASWGTPLGKTILYQEYTKFEKISVEYGLFEKIPPDKRLTIPVSVGWEDAGTWELFYRALKDSKDINVIEGGTDTEFVESERNLIIGQKGKVIAVLGLSDIAVVDTPDGLLVCRLNKTSEVKELWARLEKSKPRYIE